MENNENCVEQTENVEQTTEQIAQPSEQTEQRFTQADVDRLVKEKLDQVMPGKIARREAKIRKEYEHKYGELEGVLKAGMGKEDVGEITQDLREFYGKQNGIKLPEQPNYTAQDIEVLANADAEEIIRGGYDEVVEEVDRLTAKGIANMTAREKATFKALAEHRQGVERDRELSGLGVTEDVYGSQAFKDFASKFSASTPIKDIYDIYAKLQPKKNIQTMGSMRQRQDSGVKDFYTQEEIERLTEEDLDDPKVWEAVRRSMTGR